MTSSPLYDAVYVKAWFLQDLKWFYHVRISHRICISYPADFFNAFRLYLLRWTVKSGICIIPKSDNLSLSNKATDRPVICAVSQIRFQEWIFLMGTVSAKVGCPYHYYTNFNLSVSSLWEYISPRFKPFLICSYHGMTSSPLNAITHIGKFSLFCQYASMLFLKNICHVKI